MPFERTMEAWVRHALRFAEDLHQHLADDYHAAAAREATKPGRSWRPKKSRQRIHDADHVATCLHGAIEQIEKLKLRELKKTAGEPAPKETA